MFPWGGDMSRCDGAGGGRSALGTAPSGHRRNIPALRALYLLLHCLNTHSVPGVGTMMLLCCLNLTSFVLGYTMVDILA